MDLVQELQHIHQISQDNESVRKNLKPFLEKISTQFWETASDYYRKREEYNMRLLVLANEKIDQLKKIITENGIQAEIVATSSLHSGINLINDSDIDITILVDNCTPELKDQVGCLLSGFQYQGQVRGYYLFSQKTEVEFEIKLRERVPALPIIQLHRRMDHLSEREKIIITFSKRLFYGFPYYDMFKMLVYNMYFADIEGCYMLK